MLGAPLSPDAAGRRRRRVRTEKIKIDEEMSEKFLCLSSLTQVDGRGERKLSVFEQQKSSSFDLTFKHKNLTLGGVLKTIKAARSLRFGGGDLRRKH